MWKNLGFPLENDLQMVFTKHLLYVPPRLIRQVNGQAGLHTGRTGDKQSRQDLGKGVSL
jgi:hypothetical protein